MNESYIVQVSDVFWSLSCLATSVFVKKQ